MPGHDDCSSAVSQALLSAALGGLLCVASVGACSDMSSTGPSSGGGGGNPDFVARLRSEVKDLRENPAAVERIAREQLGLVRKNEVVFQFDKDKK